MNGGAHVVETSCGTCADGTDHRSQIARRTSAGVIVHTTREHQSGATRQLDAGAVDARGRHVRWGNPSNRRRLRLSDNRHQKAAEAAHMHYAYQPPLTAECMYTVLKILPRKPLKTINLSGGVSH
jgi:hypothetical protein